MLQVSENNIRNVSKKRLGYIDAMRGFGILSVIYSHLVVMGMRGSEYQSSIAPVIQLYFMPLFFFISGYLSAKNGDIQTISELRCLVLKKIKNLLIPTIIMFSLCVAYFRMNLIDSIVDSYKGGYWFTYVLFCIVLLYAILAKILKPFGKTGGVIHVLIVLFLHYLSRHIDVFSPMVKMTSLDFIAAFYFYFYIGTLLKKYEKNVTRYLSNGYISAVLFLLGIIPVFIEMPWYLKNVCRLILVYDILVFFQYYSTCLESDGIIPRGLRMIGRNTLEIYFLHYFFLFKIYGIDSWLITLSNDYCFRGHSCAFLIEMAVLCPIAVGIALVCIFIKKIVEPFSIVRHLCFGNN